MSIGGVVWLCNTRLQNGLDLVAALQSSDFVANIPRSQRPTLLPYDAIEMQELILMGRHDQ